MFTTYNFKMAETVLLNDLITGFTIYPINCVLWALFRVCFEKRLPVPKELIRATCGPRAACVTSLPEVAGNIQFKYVFIYYAVLIAECCTLGGVICHYTAVLWAGSALSPAT
jgi:hypothetical protein